MKQFYHFSLLLAIVGIFGACTQEVVFDQSPAARIATRAYGDKSPKIIAIIETNDTDPRNALSYHLGDTISNPCFFDIVEFFAANIHKDANGDPTIYFNPELAPLMADTTTYIKPFHDAGVKVLLSILGDAQGIGVANLTEEQANKFTDILAYIVQNYNLDGVSFDDEYAYYSTPLVSGSYARVIKQLRSKLDAKFPNEHKLIGVDQWGNYSQIDAEAGAMIDYVYHGMMGANVFVSSSSIYGVTNAQFSPQTLDINQSYSIITRNQIKIRSSQTKAGEYGAITTYDLRVAIELDPLPVLQKIAEGAFNSSVTYDGTAYPQDWTFITGGKTITYNDVQVDTPENPDPENPDPDNPDTPEPDLDFPSIPTANHGNRTPVNMTNIYTNTTNPLNAGSYYLGTSTSDPAFLDLCVLDAVKIHKATDGNPTLYLDQDMNAVLSNANTYIRPLQDKGIKVLLRILGDHQNIGVANMTDAQADIFVDLLVWTVGHFGLNGVSFDDQYADYTSTVSASFGNVIKKLRAKFDTVFPGQGRLIAVRQWNNYEQIDAAAGAMLDYVDHGSYGANIFISSSSIAEVTNDRWSPQSLKINQSYNTIIRNYIKNRSAQTKNGNYGMIMTDDMRASDDVDPLPVFQKIAEGAFDSTVTCDSVIYTKNWTQTGTQTISYATIFQQ